MKNKKSFKGFTLIEVLVALAVFTILSMVLAVMFATVIKINIKNHEINDELQLQGDAIELDDKTNATSNSSDIITFNFPSTGESIDLEVDKWEGGATDENVHIKFYE